MLHDTMQLGPVVQPSPNKHTTLETNSGTGANMSAKNTTNILTTVQLTDFFHTEKSVSE